jgi:hypothetical protein
MNEELKSSLFNKGACNIVVDYYKVLRKMEGNKKNTLLSALNPEMERLVNL